MTCVTILLLRLPLNRMTGKRPRMTATPPRIGHSQITQVGGRDGTLAPEQTAFTLRDLRAWLLQRPG
jgi:hypothetical protein